MDSLKIFNVLSTSSVSLSLLSVHSKCTRAKMVLKGGLSTLHVPYAYGFAIILLTVLVKAATFPLTKKQVEHCRICNGYAIFAASIKAIQQRYAGDQERIQLETARLYKLAGINPLAGLLTEGFFWIPSLSGPTTIAARQNGSGISWLFPFVDGHPPLGWSDTLAYLVLPMLLIVSQYISVQIMQSSQSFGVGGGDSSSGLNLSPTTSTRQPLTVRLLPSRVRSCTVANLRLQVVLSVVGLDSNGAVNFQSNDPSLKTSQALTKFLPLMIGYFALSVPSGLSLYWFTNNILSTAQQVWLQKLGGAQIPVKQFKQIKEQEARRRQQREEEKTKAEEAAANRIPTTNGGYKNEANSTKREYRLEVVVNDELSNEDSKDEQKMYVTRTESSENSVNYEVDVRDEQHINGKLEKEVIEVCTDNKPSGEETLQPRREQPTEREEV
ncbi:ALBINO3-like protein 1, chloroplastic [Vitis vinifera]|uniref:ALBINO3-like protein 1, chloroplastic n=1 Tax=Vitis vinifera TaxID=29760 RepID=A0A438GK72_VITVI|nr:ALBINO3-like protein 1, chloroplastic [Vitis vinifera]